MKSKSKTRHFSIIELGGGGGGGGWSYFFQSELGTEGVKGPTEQLQFQMVCPRLSAGFKRDKTKGVTNW